MKIFKSNIVEIIIHLFFIFIILIVFFRLLGGIILIFFIPILIYYVYSKIKMSPNEVVFSETEITIKLHNVFLKKVEHIYQIQKMDYEYDEEYVGRGIKSKTLKLLFGNKIYNFSNGIGGWSIEQTDEIIAYIKKIHSQV